MQKWIIIYLWCIIYTLPVNAQFVKVHIKDFPPAGTVTKDTVYYSSGRKLRWSDFTGKVRAASPSAALSFPGFSYDASGLQKGDTIFVTVLLQVYFDRDGSWVRPGYAGAYALSHEQLHFDIAKLAAMEFTDSLLLKKFSPEYYPIEIHFLYWTYWRKMNDLQQQFDDETHHGSDHAAEARWEKKIRRALLSGSGQGLLHDG